MRFEGAVQANSPADREDQELTSAGPKNVIGVLHIIKVGLKGALYPAVLYA